MSERDYMKPSKPATRTACTRCGYGFAILSVRGNSLICKFCGEVPL